MQIKQLSFNSMGKNFEEWENGRGKFPSIPLPMGIPHGMISNDRRKLGPRNHKSMRGGGIATRRNYAAIGKFVSSGAISGKRGGWIDERSNGKLSWLWIKR